VFVVKTDKFKSIKFEEIDTTKQSAFEVKNKIKVTQLYSYIL
jgi:hypothetical protein